MYILYIKVFLLLSSYLTTTVKGDDDEQLCRCSLVNIGKANNQQPTRLLDLSVEETNPMKTISDLVQCEIGCRIQFSKYFNLPEIAEVDQDVTIIELSNYEQASNKLCELVNRTELAPGINVLISIEKMDSDSFRKYINLGRVCCQRICACDIKSKLVKNGQIQLVQSLTSQVLPKPNVSYKCQEEINICEDECRSLVSTVLEHNSIADSTIQQVNIFEENPKLAERMCASETARLNKPGREYYFSLNVQNQVKNVYLGKTCCKLPCECSVVYGDFTTNRTETLVNLAQYLPQHTNAYYNCDDEDRMCMNDCRVAASRYFKNNAIVNYPDVPVSSLDIFSSFTTAGDVCTALNRVVDEPGFNIYIRFSTGLNPDFVEREDLDVGRICCRPYLAVFLPSNRCGAIIMPRSDEQY